MRLYNLLLEATKPSACGSNPANQVSTESDMNAKRFQGKHTWTEGTSPFITYWWCDKGSGGGGGGGGGGGVAINLPCPETDGFVTKEFQEWIWSVKNNFPKDGTKQTTRLCGTKTKCTYVEAVDGNCGKSTKTLWKELKEEFKKYKASNPVIGGGADLKKQCEDSGGTWDETTKVCTPKPVVLDQDAVKLKNDMVIYRNVLKTFDFPKEWGLIDTLSPTTYAPNNLDIFLLETVKNQIIEFINGKGRSSEFESFIRLMEAVRDAYNVDKYKDFFQQEVDPKGTDVFATIDEYINEIEDAADLAQSSYNYDPLTNPTEQQIRNFVFREVPKNVYNVDDLNLKMMVYFYTQSEPLKGSDVKMDNTVKTTLTTVQKTKNFENCKDMLAVYYQTYQKTTYDSKTLVDVKKEIQNCWCGDYYKDLGKLSGKDMFNNDLRKKRKALIKFLNMLPSTGMGDFKITLNDSVCSDIEEY